jgi:hypothetical protein
MLGSDAWIVADALDRQWATVLIILVSAATLIIGLDKEAREEPEKGNRRSCSCRLVCSPAG